MAQREEVATQGLDFAVVRQDRGNGGVKSTAFKVDGTTGVVGIAGKKMGVPVISVSAKTGDTRTVTIQLQDTLGNNLAGATPATLWVSATAGAATASGGAITGLTTSVTTGILLASVVAVTVLSVLSDANGRIVVDMTDAAGTQTYFLNVAAGDVIGSSAAVVLT